MKNRIGKQCTCPYTRSSVLVLLLVGENPQTPIVAGRNTSLVFQKLCFQKNPEHHLAVAQLEIGNDGLFRMGYNVIFEKYPKDEMRTFRNFQNNRKMNIPKNVETMLIHFWKFAITLGGEDCS
ncbi:MAG: hypothetical protein R3Y63_14545 [Eubacteriales bacterium]